MSYPHEELTPEIIAALKQIAPKLYRVKLFDQDYVIQPVTRTQWDAVMAIGKNPKATQQMFEDRVVFEGLLWPDWTIGEFKDLPAAVIPTLSQHIQARSGFRTDLPIDMKEEDEVLQERAATWDPPTEDEIKKLKTDYPGVILLKVTLEGEVYVVRSLSRSEWSAATKASDSEGMIIEKCVVFPSNLKVSELLPGVIVRLNDAVGLASGFKDEPISSEEL